MSNGAKSEPCVAGETISKLPYHAPQLTEFGTLRDITLTVGPMSMTDGGSVSGMMMTALA